jgi:hypothetical protein
MDKCDPEKCPFRLLQGLFKALPSGRGKISWCSGEIRHYENIESEAKVDLKQEGK